MSSLGHHRILLTTCGNGVMARLGNQYTGRRIAQCFYPRITSEILLLGSNAIEKPSLRGTQCMLIWGCSSANIFPVKGLDMMEVWSPGPR